MTRYAMLIDLTRCIGCDSCTLACKQDNGTPVDVFFARVLNVEAGRFPNVKRIYVPVLCNHCENPACLHACPNKAIFRRDDGIVLIDQERCRAAGACVSACPYGNIILTDRDEWYLPDDRAYERDFVRPRLREQVARKCTFCAHRVDNGLEPACVVACPTTARIFGDMEDPESKISTYIASEQQATHREPFKLIPDAGTQPANCYLGTLAAQEAKALPVGATEAPNEEQAVSRAQRPKLAATLSTLIPLLLGLIMLALAGALRGQEANVPPAEIYADSSCAACHGPNAMGALGPPLAQTKRSLDEFMRIVREGKGMMPATPASQLSDSESRAIFEHVRTLPYDERLAPMSYKIGKWLTTHDVGRLFSVVGGVSLLLLLKVIFGWLDKAGLRYLWPAVRSFGVGRAILLALWSLLVEGFLVAHLWRRNRFRWLMHGFMLYGFTALIASDLLMAIFNPDRTTLPLTHPLKLLPNAGGLLLLAGVVFVRYRYKTDPYIDNGLTLGSDYAFLALLQWTVISGFLVEILRYWGAFAWVQPVYVVHLGLVATLLITAPYTRFAHMFVVPLLMTLTRITRAVAESGVESGFVREPSPGRHHKSIRIAQQVLAEIGTPTADAELRLRYFP